MKLSDSAICAVLLLSTHASCLSFTDLLKPRDILSLWKRTGSGTESDPYRVEVDCSNPSAATISERDCKDILCFEGPWVKQHKPENKKGNYQKSGAKIVFSGSYEQIVKRGIDPVDANAAIASGLTSAEEGQYESSAQGGPGCMLDGVRASTNKQHGSILGKGMGKAGLQSGDWYKESWTNPVKNGYCEALQKTPPDTSKCDEANKDPDDPIRHTYIGIDPSYRVGGSRQFHKMNYPDDKWPGLGKYWPAPGKKREVVEGPPRANTETRNKEERREAVRAEAGKM